MVATKKTFFRAEVVQVNKSPSIRDGKMSKNIFTVHYSCRLTNKTIRKTFRCKTLLRAIRAGQRQMVGTDTETLLINGGGFCYTAEYHSYCRSDRRYVVNGRQAAWMAARGQWQPSVVRLIRR